MSQPFASLLGSFDAQMGFGLPSIGGKDSMSGTFNDIDVPPTLVSFAVDVAKEKILSLLNLRRQEIRLLNLKSARISMTSLYMKKSLSCMTRFMR